MASPRRRTERSALKYLNSVYVATIFAKLKRVLFDFAHLALFHVVVGWIPPLSLDRLGTHGA